MKTPKLHFLDSGLVCYLLGIRSPDQLRDHPLRGAVFETWVASEVLKARLHRRLSPSLSFYRDRRGAEVDLIVELGRSCLAVETKSGQTVASDFFGGLEAFAVAAMADPLQRKVDGFVVYGGTERQRRSVATVVPWSRLDACTWWDEEE